MSEGRRQAISKLRNHYGYGVRKDEESFADKIPPGGNWRSLSREDQLVFWNGKIPISGGSTNGLRKKAWDEPAGTITTSPIQKLSCQLHPGANIERSGYMEFNVTPTEPSNGLTIAELFCGGGLMAVGLKEAGFDIVWANDVNKQAIKAYRHNVGMHAVLSDITEIDPEGIPDTDIIAGGPPCQDFSVAGKHDGEEGKNGRLVWAYLNIIERKQPKAFIFENVKGLIGKRHRETFDSLITKFNEIGYRISWRLINAWDYGVAQKRERVFIVGIRRDLGFEFQFPEPDPADYRTQVLCDVIGDLPVPDQNWNVKKPERKANMSAPSPTITTQFYCQTVEISNHDEKSYWTPKSDYSYDQANRVQSLSQPSNTIPAHHNSGQPIHPQSKPRRFTVRECLRIQSAPDWYVIPEDLSLSAQYRIVGNGVACRVAWYLGKALAQQLNEYSKKEVLDWRSRLQTTIKNNSKAQ
ncbi:DNA cytosine methyltransferase [Mechercharimyces sp. CAU 1602]|nr:DNA cytosine methyltransferase [Mechercharimyces sp. CAU 1602]